MEYWQMNPICNHLLDQFLHIDTQPQILFYITIETNSTPHHNQLLFCVGRDLVREVAPQYSQLYCVGQALVVVAIIYVRRHQWWW